MINNNAQIFRWVLRNDKVIIAIVDKDIVIKCLSTF